MKIRLPRLDFGLLGRVLRIAAPHRRLLIFSAFLTVIQGFLVGFQPWLIQQTLDGYVAVGDIPGLNRMGL
ncbi:MAG: ABC transporter ATP-binding protein, partial [Bacteroidia bacterium]